MSDHFEVIVAASYLFFVALYIIASFVEPLQMSLPPPYPPSTQAPAFALIKQHFQEVRTSLTEKSPVECTGQLLMMPGPNCQDIVIGRTCFTVQGNYATQFFRVHHINV